MNTRENRKRWNLRRWLVPASLAAAMVMLPGAASTVQAGSPHKYLRKAHKDAHKHVFKHAYKAAKYLHDSHSPAHVTHYRPRGHGHFNPVHVSYYRPRVHRPVSFYLETPYVVVHGRRIDARVVYYPGDVALYESGYCPSETHYHPYESDHRVDVDVRARINVHIDF